MKKIFWGLLLNIFSVNISLGLGNIDLLPDFLGFYFLLKGFEEIHPVNASIFKVYEIIKIAFIFSVFTFAFELFGIFTMMGSVVSAFFTLIDTGLLIYIVYKFIDDFKHIETENKVELNTKKLEQFWNIYTCCIVIAIIAGMIPNYPIISIPILVVTIVIAVVFLCEFNKTKNAYLSGDYLG